jgi:2-desacetyl-2-hydroxyethyl bacteriochlorophyllide A dehydrogenase
MQLYHSAHNQWREHGETMKTIICEKPYKLKLKEVDPPLAQTGQALIRIKRVGICGTDLHAFEGNQPFFTYPRILGHELAGVIESIAENQDDLKQGDTVAIVPYLECGECIACRMGKTNCCSRLNVLGVHSDGGMQECISVPIDHLVKADGLDPDETAMVECLAIGAHAVRRTEIQPHEFVLVIGAGPIGLSTMQFAAAEGARVIAMDINDQRLEFCKEKLGVEFTLNAAGDTQTVLEQITGGEYPSIVMDATGNPESMRKALNFLSHGGKLVYIGLFIGDFSLNDPEFHKREATLLSTRNATRSDFQHVIKLMKKGAVSAKPLITHRSDFANLVDDFANWIKPENGVIKAVVDV